MKTQLVLAALTAFMMACGGSSGNNESGSLSTACISGTGTSQACTSTSNLDSAAKSAEDSACTAGQETVASSCPTAGLDGCCKIAANSSGITSETCYYSNNAAAEQSACTQSNGTWSTTP